ncbi:MAG: class I SAM-dependent methyltransferase [bacterium]|nr:class I SAM-dependent methyltransferase [bacterium]
MPQEKINARFEKGESVYDKKFLSYMAGVSEHILARADMHPSDRVLDLGCGTGELLMKLHKQEPHLKMLLGLDLSESMIVEARKKFKDIPLMEVQVGNADHIPFPDNYCNMVTMTGIMHYLINPEVVFREIARVLAPGGQVLIVDIAWEFFAMRFQHSLRRFLHPGAARLYTAQEVGEYCAKVGIIMTHSELFKAGMFGLYLVEARKPNEAFTLKEPLFTYQ